MTRSATAALAAALATVVLAGCADPQRSAPEPIAPPPSTLRGTAATAPADLQLVCASEAAIQLGASGDVLPVSSAQVGETRYQVDLTFDGGQATCIVRDDTTVESIVRT